MSRLRECKAAPGEALLEGPHLLLAALEAGLDLSDVLATPEFWDSPAAVPLRERLPGPPLMAVAALLERLADSDSPRGIVARCRLPGGTGEDLPRRAGGLYLYLDGLQDPGNLGAIARVAEAAGVSGLVLAPGSVRREHPRSLRASAGSLLRLPTAASLTLVGLLEHLEGLAPRCLRLEPRDGTPLPACDLAGTLILILGAEGRGVSAAVRSLCHEAVSIPMHGPVDSLNVAVAAALVLYQRQFGARVNPAPPRAGPR